MITDIQQLFTDTKIAFDKSEIKRFADQNNYKWYYSVSSTKLKLDSNLIVGFNWGAADNVIYEPQIEIPIESFEDLYNKKDLGSLQRIYNQLKHYLSEEEIENCVQTNFCFFRSDKEEQISVADLALSTPLFQQLLLITKPKRIIGFSNKLRDYFLRNNLCSSVETLDIPSNKKTLFTAKGFYIAEKEEIPIYFLPHPNSKFITQARQNAWEFCFVKKTLM